MTNSKNEITHTYHIDGMSCGGCATTVEHKLATIPDVVSVKIDLETKQAEIISKQMVKINELQKKLDNTGYTIAELGA